MATPRIHVEPKESADQQGIVPLTSVADELIGRDGSVDGKPVSQVIVGLFLENAQPKAARFVRVTLRVRDVPRPEKFVPLKNSFRYEPKDNVVRGEAVFLQFGEDLVVYKGDGVQLGNVLVAWTQGIHPERITFITGLYNLEGEPKEVIASHPIHWIEKATCSQNKLRYSANQKTWGEGVMGMMEGIISVVSLIVSSLVAYFVAKRFGDVAGQDAARRFQEEDTKRGRVAAFQSLINVVARIQKLVEYYQSPDFGTRGVPKLPVTAFEMAFVSGSPGLAARSELLDAVNNYLVLADSINSLIDIYLASQTKFGNLGEIKRACPPLSEVLNRLGDCLQRELNLLLKEAHSG